MQETLFTEEAGFYSASTAATEGLYYVCNLPGNVCFARFAQQAPAPVCEDSAARRGSTSSADGSAPDASTFGSHAFRAPGDAERPDEARPSRTA